MPFAVDGFLSSGLSDAFVRPTREAHASWFALVEDLNRAAMAVRSRLQPQRSSVQQLFGAVLYARILTSYQGAIILAERGMLVDARALVRSAAEATIALTAIANDEKFSDRLIESHQRHRLTVANIFLQNAPTREPLTPDQVTALRSVVDEIINDYPQKPNGITWADVAAANGLNVLYDTVYRDTSNDGVHVSLDSLSRYIKEDAQGGIEALDFRPSDIGLDDTLSLLATVLLHATEAVAKIFPEANAGGLTRDYLDRWRALLGYAPSEPAS